MRMAISIIMIIMTIILIMANAMANKKSWKRSFWVPLNRGFRFRALQAFEQTKNLFNIKMFIFCQLWQGTRFQIKRSLWKAEVPWGKKDKKRLNLFGPTNTKRGRKSVFIHGAVTKSKLLHRVSRNTFLSTSAVHSLSWQLVQVRCVPSSLDEVWIKSLTSLKSLQRVNLLCRSEIDVIQPCNSNYWKVWSLK